MPHASRTRTADPARPAKRQPFRLAMLCDPRDAFVRDVCVGVAGYAGTQPDVRIIRIRRIHDAREWGADGAVGFAWSEENALRLSEAVRVAVSVSNSPMECVVPQVVNDDVEVGRMGARYLLARGFRSFAFLGSPTRYSLERLEGFRSALGRAPLVEITPEPGAWKSELRRLPIRTALMVASDHLAQMVLVRVTEADPAAVPQRLAILGVDNDPIDCAYSKVSLSSIRLNGVRLGFEAARLSHEIWLGRRPATPGVVRRVMPIEVVTRQSTDTLATDNPTLRRVMDLLRHSATDPVSVMQLARQAHVGRRTLERLFREHLQTSPAALAMGIRLDLACRQLIDSTDSIARVAENTGFGDPRLLFRAFQLQFGTSPSAFRRDHGGRRPG